MDDIIKISNDIAIGHFFESDGTYGGQGKRMYFPKIYQ